MESCKNKQFSKLSTKQNNKNFNKLILFIVNKHKKLLLNSSQQHNAKIIKMYGRPKWPRCKHDISKSDQNKLQSIE